MVSKKKIIESNEYSNMLTHLGRINERVFDLEKEVRELKEKNEKLVKEFRLLFARYIEGSL